MNIQYNKKINYVPKYILTYFDPCYRQSFETII